MSSDSGDVSELSQQLRALSPDPSYVDTKFVVHDSGWVIRVDYSCGSCANLTLEAPFNRPAGTASPEGPSGGYRGAAGPALVAPRPLDIELRPEDGGDVAAKHGGLSVEWQSGDAAFDAAIYVSTPITDTAVLAAVLCEPVRRAVLALREQGFYKVHIDDHAGNVCVDFQEFPSRTPRPDRARMAIRAFVQLLANLPTVTSAGPSARAPLRGWTTFLYGCASVWVAYVCLGAWNVRALPVSIGPLVAALAASILVGLLGARIFGRLVQARVRGTSRAHTLTEEAWWAGFGGVSAIVFGVLFVLAAIFAPSSR